MNSTMNSQSGKVSYVTEKDTKDPAVHLDFGEVQGTHLKATIPLIFNSSTDYEPRTQEQLSAWYEDLKPCIVEYLYEAGHIQSDGQNNDNVMNYVQNTFSLLYFATNPKQIGRTSAQIKHLLRLFVTTLLADDFMETTDVYPDCGEPGLSLFTKLITNTIRGEYKSMHDIPNVIPGLMEYLRGFYLSHKAGHETLPNFATTSKLSADRVIEPLEANKILLNTIKLAQSGKDEDQVQLLHHATFASVRVTDFGGSVFLALFENLAGIHLDEELRGHLLVKRISDLASSIGANFNDIIGLKRDIKNDGISALLYRVSYGEKWTLEQSFAHSVNQIIKQTEELKSIAAHLRRFGHKKLNEYTTMVETFCHGHILWALQTKKRYSVNEIRFINYDMQEVDREQTHLSNGGKKAI